MNPVTDSKLLSELEGTGQPVTDTVLLNQLEGSDNSVNTQKRPPGWYQGEPEKEKSMLELFNATTNPISGAWNVLMSFVPEKTREEESDKALRSIEMANRINAGYASKGENKTIRFSEVYSNFNEFERSMNDSIFTKDPTIEELLFSLPLPGQKPKDWKLGAMGPLLGVGLATQPIATVIGAVGGTAIYQAMSEIESVAVNLLKDTKYKIFHNKGISALLPEEASEFSTKVVDSLSMIGKLLIAGKIMQQAPSVAQQFTTEIIEQYNLPKKLYISPKDLKAELQTGGVVPAQEMEIYKSMGYSGAEVRRALKEGVHIEVPAEKVVIMQDRPWFSAVKKVLKIDPKQTITRTLAEQAKKGVSGAIENKPIEKPVTEFTESHAERLFERDMSDEAILKAIEKPQAEEEIIADIVKESNPTEVTVETGGFQTIYEALAEKVGIPETAYSDIFELGKYVYDKGKTTAKAWAESMREHLGKMWDTFKEFIGKAWDDVKAFNQKLGEAGTLGKKDIKSIEKMDSTIKTSQVKKQIREATGQIRPAQLVGEYDALKAGMIKSVRAGREAYKLGNKEGVATERTRLMQLQEQKKLQEIAKEEIKTLTDEIKEVKKSLNTLHSEVADVIKPIIDSIDFSNMSESKRLELQPLYAYYKSGDVEIPEELIKPLEKLDKKPIRDITLNELRDIHATIMEYANQSGKLIKQEAEYDDAIKRFSKIKSNIAVSYQKLIRDFTKDIDLKKVSEKNIEELKTLKEFLDNTNPEEIGMTKETYDMLRERTERLNKNRLSDMTVEEKGQIVDTLKRLNAQGRLMRKLELAKRGRTIQDMQNELIDTTQPINPKDTWLRNATKEAYLSTLPSYHVSSMLDGFVENGINNRFIADQFTMENMAEYAAHNQRLSFIEKAKGIKPEWTELEQQRIVVKALDIMGATSQRDMLMAELKMEEMPQLTAEENALMSLMEQTANQNKSEIIPIYEYRENSIFPELERYIMPLKYTTQLGHVDSEVLRQDYFKTKAVRDDFTIARKQGVKKLIRTDVFNIINEMLNEQNWYIHMQPLLDTQAAALFTKSYKEQAGALGYDWWKDQIDIVARRGRSAKADTMFRRVALGLKEARINLNNAIMTYKISTVAMQIFSAFDGMAFALTNQQYGAAARTIPQVIKAWIQFNRPQIYELSQALQLRHGGEMALKEIEDIGVKNKIIEKGYSALKEADLRTAIGVMSAYHGNMDGATTESIQNAEFLMTVAQGGSSVALNPHVLASGEIARTAFTFQSFFLARWGTVASAIIHKSIIKGKSAKQRAAGIAALSIIIMSGILEDEVRQKLWETVSGKKKKKSASLARKALAQVPGTIPIFGGAISAAIEGDRLETDVPIVRVAKKGIYGAIDMVSKEEREKRIKGAMNVIETILSVQYGIPGTAQIADLIEGQIERNK